MEEIVGDFVIMKDGRMFVGGRKLRGDDVVNLSVKKIKRIILDAKEGLI